MVAGDGTLPARCRARTRARGRMEDKIRSEFCLMKGSSTSPPSDALDALIVGISSRKVNFILDADIRSFFTEVSQQWVVCFLEHRIGDMRILRLVQKWLRAGVLEDGIVTVEEEGTGQGSVISPLLSNIYLHYVFDLWAKRWRR